MVSRLNFLLMAAIAFSTMAPAGAQTVDKMLGGYSAPRNANPLHSLVLAKDTRTNKVTLKVAAWGFPNDSDWGETTADVYNPEEGNSARILAHYTVNDVKMTLFIQPFNGGILVHCFQDQAGHPKSYFEQQLSKNQQ